MTGSDEQTPQESGATLPTWVQVVVVAVILVAVAAGMAYFIQPYMTRLRPAQPEVQMTPIVGGMSLANSPLEPEGGPAVAATKAATSAPTPTASNFLPGETVLAGVPAVQVFADADPASPLLDAYDKGSMFTVLEPSGDYGTYPVRQGSVTWLRVRSEDGLVGWVQADSVVSAH